MIYLRKQYGRHIAFIADVLIFSDLSEKIIKFSSKSRITRQFKNYLRNYLLYLKRLPWNTMSKLWYIKWNLVNLYKQIYIFLHEYLSSITWDLFEQFSSKSVRILLRTYYSRAVLLEICWCFIFFFEHCLFGSRIFPVFCIISKMHACFISIGWTYPHVNPVKSNHAVAGCVWLLNAFSQVPITPNTSIVTNHISRRFSIPLYYVDI